MRLVAHCVALHGALITFQQRIYFLPVVRPAAGGVCSADACRARGGTNTGIIGSVSPVLPDCTTETCPVTRSVSWRIYWYISVSVGYLLSEVLDWAGLSQYQGGQWSDRGLGDTALWPSGVNTEQPAAILYHCPSVHLSVRSSHLSELLLIWLKTNKSEN